MNFELFKHNFLILSKADDGFNTSGFSQKIFAVAEDLTQQNIKLPEAKETMSWDARRMQEHNLIASGQTERTGSYVVYMSELYPDTLILEFADY